MEEKINLLIEENKNQKLIAEKEKKENKEIINSLFKKIEELEIKINSLTEDKKKEKKEAEDIINSLNKKNEEMELKLNNLHNSINEDILNVYSYECINDNKPLEKTIYEGNEQAKIEIVLKNNGEEPWPLNKTKLIYDKESLLKEKDILLEPQKLGEEKKYEIILNNLGKLQLGEYKCILSFGVGLKTFGEKIILKLNVKEKAIENLRTEYGLLEKDFSDEKLLKVLKRNNFNFEKAFEELFN